MISVDDDNSNILSVRSDALNNSTLNFNNHVSHGLLLIQILNWQAFEIHRNLSLNIAKTRRLPRSLILSLRWDGLISIIVLDYPS